MKEEEVDESPHTWIANVAGALRCHLPLFSGDK